MALVARVRHGLSAGAVHERQLHAHFNFRRCDGTACAARRAGSRPIADQAGRVRPGDCQRRELSRRYGRRHQKRQGTVIRRCQRAHVGQSHLEKKEIYSYLDEHSHLIRPANFPAGAPGKGWHVWRHNSFSALVINLQGRVFMPNHVEDPFRCVDEILKQQGAQSPVIIVDMHAEATSEKNAMGWYLDGRASVVFGTHTHVQTADDRILPDGTAYITDVGMCGPFDSVIGMEKETVIRGFITQLPRQFQVAEDNVVLQGIIVDVDEASGKARAIRRLRQHWEAQH